ncbi:MAG TPA: phosphopantothenate/pantothenate synthetase [Thermoplasmatales archaeon]|nr:phosphopantothenate/pantothenate synthetase [Thermoplasmatales archaeon]
MIPCNHPRYESLMLRSRIEEGVKNGIVHPTGLIAHGRGEAFDYLIGEKTQKFAENAIKAGVAYLKIAENPVISVNGNTAILSAEEIVKLAEKIKAKIEVNLFHRSEKRIKKIISFLEEKGGKNILGIEGDARIKGLSHDRAICSYDGIYSGDVILVPLEDGDRCEALKKMGKVVITVDLNPLSRTARNADVTIVDNVVRAMPALIKQFEKIKNPEEIIKKWNNEKNLQIALDFICSRLRKFYRNYNLNLL